MKYVLSAAVVVLIIFSSISLGNTVQSASSGVWSSASTWQSGVKPGVTDTVIILAGHTVTVDTDYTVSKMTVKGSAVVQFDGVDNRTLTTTGDLIIETNGKIIPCADFVSGATTYNKVVIGQNLTVDGLIQARVFGSTSGYRDINHVVIGNLPTASHSVLQGTGSITTEYLDINKSAATDTVTIQPGLTISTTYIYLFLGTLDNSLNRISTASAARFNDASVMSAMPLYISGGDVIYYGGTNIKAGVELPDTVSALETQNSYKEVTLNKNVVVTGTLRFAWSGVVNTGAYTLKVNGEVANGYPPDPGYVIGSLEKPMSTALADTEKVFEVGGTNGPAYVTLKFDSLKSAGTIVVNSHEAMFNNIVDTTQALRRYWDVTAKNGFTFGKCNATLQYTTNDFVNNISEATDEAAMVVGQYGTDNLWHFPAVGVRNTAGPGGTIQAVGTTSLSTFAIGKNSAALPVELTTFSASAHGNIVELQWRTATETNNYGFEIQQSTLGVQLSEKGWKKVGFIAGNGTSSAPHQYSFVDKPVTGKYAYRIKQIDRDGKFAFSQSIEVAVGAAPNNFGLDQNYPNPFNPTTSIAYQLPVSGHVSLKVYDALGREVATLVDEVKEAGSYNVPFHAGTFSSGMYFYRLTAGPFSTLKKMVLVK